MRELLTASYGAALEMGGRRTVQELALSARPGESIYIYGSPDKCRLHFNVLCGLQAPERGRISLDGQDLYSMEPKALAGLRGNWIGAIPSGGGLIPELRMIDQVVLPMKLAGFSKEAMLSRLQELTCEAMPLHSLCNRSGSCNPRKQAYAAIFRAVIQKPKLLVIQGFLDDFDSSDANALWQTLLHHRGRESVLIYLSGAPAPKCVSWSQEIRLT